jgi:hypothetical protein
MRNEPIISSATWMREFRPHVNGKYVRWDDLSLNLSASDVCTLTLEYEYSFLIGDPDAFIRLEYKPGKEGQGLMFDPPLGQLCEMSEGTTSLSWVINAGEASSGDFELQFAIPRIEELPVSPSIPGAVFILEEELDVSLDRIDVAFGGVAYPCLGARHQLTVQPKPGSRLLDERVKMSMTGTDLGVRFRPALANEQILVSTGAKWEVDCDGLTKNGDFYLQLEFAAVGIKTASLRMSLAHNLVSAEFWFVRHDPWGLPAWSSYHVRATSRYTYKPASGVQVKKYNNGAAVYLATDSNGEVVTDSREGYGPYASILNRYDGSVVGQDPREG